MLEDSHSLSAFKALIFGSFMHLSIYSSKRRERPSILQCNSERSPWSLQTLQVRGPASSKTVHAADTTGSRGLATTSGLKVYWNDWQNSGKHDIYECSSTVKNTSQHQEKEEAWRESLGGSQTQTCEPRPQRIRTAPASCTWTHSSPGRLAPALTYLSGWHLVHN